LNASKGPGGGSSFSSGSSGGAGGSNMGGGKPPNGPKIVLEVRHLKNSNDPKANHFEISGEVSGKRTTFHYKRAKNPHATSQEYLKI